MSHSYLTLNDRNKIEVLKSEGYSSRRIAKILGYHHSTISRELKRRNDKYEAKKANLDYSINSRNKGRRSKLTEDLKEFIKDKLESTRCLEQIIGRCFQGKLSFKTIYNWLYKGLFDISPQVLRRKGKSLKTQEKRGKFNIGTSISKRPKIVNKRVEFGHWELDTVVSSRGKNKGCLATFAEMKTRAYFAIKMPDRSKNSMLEAIHVLTEQLPPGAFKTFTSDRGKEFACYEKVKNELNVDFYFADTYSAWQRGTNENSNGLLREFFPKKTDLAKIKNKELVDAIYKINSRPRKCLEFDMPFERFMHELNLLGEVSQ